jgi:hypothetical protein
MKEKGANCAKGEKWKQKCKWGKEKMAAATNWTIGRFSEGAKRNEWINWINWMGIIKGGNFEGH